MIGLLKVDLIIFNSFPMRSIFIKLSHLIPFVFFVVINLPLMLHAQAPEGTWLIGLKGGGQYFSFRKDDLLSSFYKAMETNCIHESKYRYGANLSVFFYKRPNQERFAWQNEISYSFRIQGDPIKDYDLMYKSTSYNSDLFYQLNYEYLNISTLAKIYLDYSRQNVVESGIHVILGGQVSLITADDKINLGSTDIDPSTLLNIRSTYRDTYRGLNNISLFGGIGWDGGEDSKLNPLNLDLRYYLGFKDLLETKNANLGGKESLVKASYIELSIGIIFPRFN
ncbi:MAG: hypothetical protein SFV55_21240 [Haliscomenobacter sp.]|uniref:outer membrane beta-barrel protein n=1 Tax=Haliscomenobacter sp. TaxID=2717303 RepID=UPI0029A377F9|nr:outer membrane beta-barrel protein [Haliscomenobacter sp.]MDX2070968.1 hypothetical protein [Haliscomenobacter sp.]